MADRFMRERAAVASGGASLLDWLVADARAVRRLWPLPAQLLAWLAVGAGVLVWTAWRGLRPDLSVRLHDPSFLLEVGLLLGAAILLAVGALATAVPGGEPRRGRLVLMLVLAAAAWMVPACRPGDGEVPLAGFVDAALVCEGRTALLGLPALGALLLALSRGAPLAAATAGALAGAAAFLLACANMRVFCATDTRLHLLIGHSFPAGLGIGVSAVAGAVWLRGWRRRDRGVFRRRLPRGSAAPGN